MHSGYMHAELIDQLGGYQEVARQLNLKPNRVRMWRKRGIAWEYRTTVARIAMVQRIKVPADFLEPALERPFP